MTNEPKPNLETADQIRKSIPLEFNYTNYRIKNLSKAAVCKVEFIFARDGICEPGSRRTRSFRFYHKPDAEKWAMDMHLQLGGTLINGKKPTRGIRQTAISSENRKKILALYYEGFNNQQIAEKLGLSHTAVTDHMREMKNEMAAKKEKSSVKEQLPAKEESNLSTEVDRLKKRLKSLENTVLILTKTIKQNTQGK